MFQDLKLLPPDPILGLNQAFQKDSNTKKINLSVGVYQTETGLTPIFNAVKQAEHALLQKQQTKSYIAQVGDADYLNGISQLALGSGVVSDLAGRLSIIATPGGCGALRMGAELIASSVKNPRIWVSDPTWGNHYPLLEEAGLQLSKYTYYDFKQHGLDFNGLLNSLQDIPQGDIVLLHASCHNPSGADLTEHQWDQVIDVCQQRNLIPFFDSAYQGFGQSIDEDMYAVRKAAKILPEMLIAYSCSKNFGMYRERVGAIFIITEDEKQTQAVASHVLSAARRSYSMSPYHGCGVVGELLKSTELYQDWKNELSTICARINQLRTDLATGLNDQQSKVDFSYLTQGKGMFSFINLSLEQVHLLRNKHGLYILDNTRANMAGLSNQNIDEVINTITSVI